MKFDHFMKKSDLISLHRRHQRVFTRVSQGLKTHQLNLHESLILLALFFEQGSAGPGELAQTLDLGADQLSQALRRLEEKSLVRRKLSDRDGRRRQISLSALGRKLGPLLVGLFDSIEKELEQGLFD
jgi:DNA-binding MarR family transcriptional regulator